MTIKKVTLTPQEQKGIDRLRAALEELPASLLLDIETFDPDGICVYKKAQPHVHQEVARIFCRVLN